MPDWGEFTRRAEANRRKGDMEELHFRSVDGNYAITGLIIL